jgi:hypothetical protein
MHFVSHWAALWSAVITRRHSADLLSSPDVTRPICCHHQTLIGRSAVITRRYSADLLSSPDVTRPICCHHQTSLGRSNREKSDLRECGTSGRKICSLKVLVVKPEGRRWFGRPRHRWEVNIKLYLQQVGQGGMYGFVLAQNSDEGYGF